MTENKRFDDAKSYVYDGKNCIGIINDDFTCENIVDLLNALNDENEELKEEIARQKYTKHIMRENIKSYERAIKHLRKSYEKFDEMRLDRIRFLEKKLKKNGLNIYVNDCGDLEEWLKNYLILVYFVY